MEGQTFWLYKCNSRNEAYQSGWGDWNELFQEDEGRWGGLWSTKHPRSREIIENEMRPGHLIFCYQTDRRELMGICRLVKFVNVPTGTKAGRNLYLKVVEQFKPPVKIHLLKRRYPELKYMRSLVSGPIQTIYDVNTEEAALLLKVCRATVSAKQKPNSSATFRGGAAGFGDPKKNPKVEERAIRFVTDWYTNTGWEVHSREREKLGYDLECHRGGCIEHVEVKGASGKTEGVIVTAGEYDRLRRDRRAILALVGNVLSRRPTFERIRGKQAQHLFEFRPLSYMAVRRKRI